MGPFIMLDHFGPVTHANSEAELVGAIEAYNASRFGRIGQTR